MSQNIASTETQDSQPAIFHTFTVKSGAVCFGALHNIWGGSLTDISPFPNVRPQTSGTVIVQTFPYNLVAENGTWNVYTLVNAGSNDVTAWFTCHSDVDPKVEIDKILRVSGSPYEEDSGSRMNDDDTAREGVFVINRYDWGYYNEEYMDLIGEEEEEESDILAVSNSLGIVEYAVAQEQVKVWKELRPSRREPSEAGAWMYIPGGEYMFGRFGFNDERTAARSFLFFSAGTNFMRAVLDDGMKRPLRKEETSEERFDRKLREGHDFSGINWLQKSYFEQTPPETELLGPYDLNEHLFKSSDFIAMMKYWDGIRINEMASQWTESICDLLNELVLVWVEKFILPRAQGHATMEIAAKSLFPDHADDKNIDYHTYYHFMSLTEKTELEIERDTIKRKLKEFIINRNSDNTTAVDDNLVAGISRAVIYLVFETLELSGNYTLDSGRKRLVPFDVRLALVNDEELFGFFKYSNLYWNGRNEIVA